MRLITFRDNLIVLEPLKIEAQKLTLRCRTYTPVCSADEQAGTTGCALCKLYKRTYLGPPDVRYFWNTL